MLARLLRRKRLTVIGLNSGTSADGIDVAAVAINRDRRGYQTRLMAHASRRYPDDVRRAVLATADAATIRPDDLIYLDQALGKLFGRAARTLVKRLDRSGHKIDLVASHGQTVRHLPSATTYLGHRVRGTMQLGNLEQIATITGLPTVGDFRQADIAVGGEGAPITAGAVQRLLAVPGESRLIVNIGGMANLFYFPARRTGKKPQARDCGPGNVLCDILAERLIRRPFDRGGGLASRGTVAKTLLNRLWRSVKGGPRTASTGREKFGPPMVDRMIAFASKYRLGKADLMATAVELTARSIADDVAPLIRDDHRLTSLYLTGGGRRNSFLVKRLRALLAPVPVAAVEQLGLHGDFVEAASYAVLGEAALRGEALPVIAGPAWKKARPILGRIVQAPLASRKRA